MSGNMNDRGYFQNLIVIAYSDGIVCERERRYLVKRAKEYKFSEIELNELIAIAPTLEFVMPSSWYVKMSYLRDCVEMAMADGVVTQKELNFCKIICQMLEMDQHYLAHTMSAKEIRLIL